MSNLRLNRWAKQNYRLIRRADAFLSNRLSVLLEIFITGECEDI